MPVYDYLLDKLKEICEQDIDNNEFEAIIAAMEKIRKYYSLAEASVYYIATILDPRLKLDYYKQHKWEKKWIKMAKQSIENTYNNFYAPTSVETPTNYESVETSAESSISA